MCSHVGPDVLACWSWDRGGAISGRFVILSFLVLFVVPKGKVQWDFCNAVGMLVLMCWHVGPGIDEVPTQAGLAYCLVLFFLVPEGKVQRDFCNASCLSDLL